MSQSISTQTIQSLQKKHLHDNSPILTTAVPSADGQGDSEDDSQISDIDFCFLLDRVSNEQDSCSPPGNLPSFPLVHSAGSSTSSTTRDLRASGIIQHKPPNTSGLHEYVSREESQQRRLANASQKKTGSDSESDLFGRDDDMRMMLRRAKTVAARELAQVSTTVMPKHKNEVQARQTCLGDDDPIDSHIISGLQSPIVDAPSPRSALNNGAVFAKNSFDSFIFIGSGVAKGKDSVVGNQSPVRSQSPTHAAGQVASYHGTDGIYNRSSQDVVANNLRKPMSSMTPIQNPLRLFSSMAFAISYKADTAQDKDDRRAVMLLIKAHGGHLLNGFEGLFTDVVSCKQNGELVPAPAARDLSFVAFIGDHYTRKSKFVQALALGLPCLSSRWVMDCVARERILPFSPFLLAAGESTYLHGAVRSRLLRAYDPTTARFQETFARREKLLSGKRVVFLMGKGKGAQRKKAYLFLIRASGAGDVMKVASMREAIELVLGMGEWDLLYVNDKDVTRAEAGILEGLMEQRQKANSQEGKRRKTRKRKWVEAYKENEASCAEQERKRVRVVGDEFVVQSLILGSLVDEEVRRF
ncbi:hypothetical protein VE03_10412 [Pseudogymnoascus sp. 23342-1-I1]|nr:hypothetical protein VE03_10412 [Pseudogymnoascus sp. 23342-1-I1]